MPRWLVLLFLILVSVGTFAGTSVAIRALAPMEVEEVTPKLAFFRAHKDEFDTVFIGSSRVYHGLSPKIFDQTLQKAGITAHSFNLAVNGMMPPESIMMARRVADMRPKNLRRIFFEISDLRVVSSKKISTRDTYWHGFDAVIFALEKFKHEFATARESAWDELSTHFRLFARNCANLGRATEIYERLSGTLKTKNSSRMLGADMDGYLSEPHPMPEKERLKLVDALEKIRAGNAPPRTLNEVNRDALSKLGYYLARRGIEIEFFVTPTTTRDYNAKLDAPEWAFVWAFDDPNAFENLYRADRRFDYDHLNPLGAEEFSRLFAQRWLIRLGTE